MRTSYIEVSKISGSQVNWRGFAPLEQKIVSISSQTTADIQLPDVDALSVNGRQGQLLVHPVSQERFGYLLFNLSETLVTYQPYLQSVENPERQLAYGGSVELGDRDKVIFGGYRLLFVVGDHEVTELTIQMIKFEGDTNRLYPDRPLKGEVWVSSPSNQAIQPLVEVSGTPNKVLPADQASNLAKSIKVPFELFHPRTIKPLPGAHQITFQVSAKKFPGKFAVRVQTVMIEPYPHHRIALEPNALRPRRST